MSNNFGEVYYVLEEALELAFKGKFVIRLYDYFNVRGVTKAEADQFLRSSTAKELADEVIELNEYIKGGNDSSHKQIREAYHHIPKPQARKIRDYLASILEDAVRYRNDRKRGRRKKDSK
tara:strand:+ start:562 stop:921 length:360 start_codon:yes stop_codon:yes gene_type:complete